MEPTQEEMMKVINSRVLQKMANANKKIRKTWQYFEITPQHLKLLQRMEVYWDGCEYGAPAIDCKRPYGNSDVEEDICEILGFKPVEINDSIPKKYYSDKDKKYAAKIHHELENALQICLKFLEFKPGKFKRDTPCTFSWRKC